MATILLGFKPGTLTAAQTSQIQAAAPEMTVLETHDREQIEGVLGNIEIAAGGFPRELLARAKNLRWLQQWGAGADWLLRYPEAVEMDFVLTNASGVHAIPISEHIFAFLFAFARDLPAAVQRQAKHTWGRPARQEHVFELAGKTLLLIGVGAIGERTAQLGRAMGMRVMGVRRNPDQTLPEVEVMVGPEQLHEVLPNADFVVLTIPMTQQTHHMIGKPELQLMKPGAYIVNIGRGGTIDEAELVTALESGKIAGAGLDVFETEPLPEESPLWSMDNVIITAHYSGSTPKYNDRAMEIFLTNLQRYRADLPLQNIVDKKLGY